MNIKELNELLKPHGLEAEEGTGTLRLTEKSVQTLADFAHRLSNMFRF